MARVSLISPEDANPEQLAFYAEVQEWLKPLPGPRGGGRVIPQPWRALAHNPRLAKILFEGSRYILSELPWAQAHLRLRQIAILAVVRRLNFEFAYVGHWPMSERAGLSRAHYEMFKDWDGLEAAKTSALFTAEEQLIISFADQMTSNANADPETFARIVGLYGETGAVELTALIAYRVFTSVLLGTLGVGDD